MEKNKYHIKKDDKVRVICGKDRGKIGKVMKIDRKKRRLIVENINIVKRHLRPGIQARQGGIVEREASIHMSNVMLICSKCVTPVRVKVQRLENGKKVRVCRKCNEFIDD